ncbi:MAG: DUF106 domain-containing protein [Nitrososphaerota archaeon]|jgi:uncharacterized membrane protein (DUF106 family)|nr:DUF106 domain-containing protein [Nitrososphaerota archaeon]
MSSSKKRQQNRSSVGGSRTITYILIAVIGVLVFYYAVRPVVFPQSTVTTAPNGAKVSLSTGSDIPGVYVVISGQNLPAGKNVSAVFGTSPLPLTNSTTKQPGCQTSSKGTVSGCTFWVPNLAVGHYDINFTAGGTTVVDKFAVPQYAPPVSTIIVTVTSISLGMVTQLVTRKVVDLNAERRMRAEVNAFNKEKREATMALQRAKATLSKDKEGGSQAKAAVAKEQDKLERLKKRELAMQQEQLNVQKARFKVMGITTVPLILVYYLMATFLGGYGVVVAFTPIPIPVITGVTQSPAIYDVSLFWWYFLSSFTFSTMLGRLLHTTS